MTKLIIGLGNPGDEYKHTRHNIGFLVLDEVAKQLEERWKHKSRLSAEIIKGRVGEDQVILAKPSTYMNRSGQAVAALKQRFKPDQIVVVHDDADLPFGEIRIKSGGGSAGHNGIKSMTQELGTDLFDRIRVGIGRPKNEKHPLDKWVLGVWGRDEERVIPEIVNRAIETLFTK